ncbi:HD-GYP domain-containing protein [Balneatrix alpica]|uniref:HD-GYP domain-containing protein n=1 Tax=Balneatrix alpica TaxID=75684 RepID=A0ABV5ZCY3_9GAMM|nr:HD domain-containing phosphohydrolase [Balneatrix alpica]
MPLLEYETTKVDVYVEHLAEVNNHNTVLASDDLYNEQGVLLAKKGMAINSKTAERLIRHKLKQPLEQSVTLAHSLTREQLWADLNQQFKHSADLLALSQHLTEASLLEARDWVMRLPLVVQKLTVLRARLPDQYRKALFCAWFGFAIASRLQRPDVIPREIFLAGLVHDIGMLHLRPEILNKERELSPEEWRAIQSHVLIGKMFLETIKEVPKTVISAVLEHHERCDGSGYPSARFKEEISTASQVIAIADTLYALRFSKGHAQHDFLMLLPVLQINDFWFQPEVYEASRSLIKLAGIRPSRLFGNDEDLLAALPKLVKTAKQLNSYAEQTIKLLELLPKEPSKHRYLRSLQAITQALDALVSRSGILTDGIQRWIAHVYQNKLDSSYAEMEEIILMYDELLWRFREQKRVLHIVEQEAPEPLKTQLSALYAQMEPQATQAKSA